MGSAAPAASAAPTDLVDLGTASTYAVISGASVANTVNAVGTPHTTLRGDLGVVPATEPTGFPPGVVTGTKRIGGPEVAQAHADAVAAYTDIATRPGGTPLAGDLAGLTLAPGLHSTAAAVSNTGTVTLDAAGDQSAVFVFKIGAAMTMAVNAKVVLAGGAQASRIFWQVNGAAAVGAGAEFAGTLIAMDAIAIGANTEVNGRAIARTGAISLNANEFYSGPPAVTIDGGATAITTDTTPTISGTTDLMAPGVVTVTIDGQTLTATPSGGAWSVTSAILANAVYSVTASAVDGAGNATTATQQLTVDTVLPVVAINGGAVVLTKDATPTISGTSDVAPGTVVDVTVDGQTLTALVQAAGTWNIAPSALPDGTHAVTARVLDPAGNEGTSGQLLTVDTTAPAVTITGGANALTNDATPTITGTAAVDAGTTVTIDLADETLTGLVSGSGEWSVEASALSNGPHRVRLAVTDAAGNGASATQWLTVDTVSPLVTITGGAAMTTSDLRPTITGTSDAAPGTIVTVTIAGQTMTTVLQVNGSWNVTPATVGEGEWPVLASVPDPAGNAGTATQLLTIALAVTPMPTPTPTPAPTATPAPGTPGAPGADGGTGTAGAPGSAGTPGATGPTGTTTPTLAVSLPAKAKSLTLKRGKKLRMRFTVSGPATVTLKVFRGKKLVATKRVKRSKAGKGSVTWDGKTKGKYAPKGKYTVRLRAVLKAGGPVGKSSVALRVK